MKFYMDISSEFLGLKLASPIIAGSCGLTDDLDNLRRMEDCGVGAIVLKTIFEEQIIFDIKKNTHIVAPVENYGESYRFVASHMADDALERHFEFISRAHEALSVPIIGCISCYSHENWINYVQKFIDAGCSAIELNMDILPYETSLSCDDVDRTYGDIIRTIRKITAAPLSIRVGRNFTDMAKFMQLLSWMGVQGVTMFDNPLNFDIDIESQTVRKATGLTPESDLYDMLRWVAILKNKMRCAICASTAIYTPEDLVKILLAGAGTVQVVSTLYKNGIDQIRVLNEGLKDWMNRKGYEKLGDFRGRLALKENEVASMLLRTSCMKSVLGGTESDSSLF